MEIQDEMHITSNEIQCHILKKILTSDLDGTKESK